MSSSPPLIVADRYRLVAPLGQGGMGRVWRATDVVLHREVAIKELVPPPGLTPAERQEMRERSLREARAIARLNNINVVRVFDVLRTDADPWIVMEYVPSRSLQDAIAADGPYSAVRTAEIGLGVLNALKAAHRAGVVHRDIKPGNVLMGGDGRVVLTDFGLATVPGDPNVTRTGLVLGSPAYIAPERARDGTAGPAADLWSLGATLYAAVEGQSPFARPSAIATLAALATENVPPARNAGPLKPVLNGLLRKDPAHRIDADEAERLLARAAGRRSKISFPMSPTMRRPGVGRERPSLPSGPGGPPVLPGSGFATATGSAPVVPTPRPPVTSRPGDAPSRSQSGPDGAGNNSPGRPTIPPAPPGRQNFTPGRATVGNQPPPAARPGQSPTSPARPGQAPVSPARPGQAPGSAARPGQAPGSVARPGQVPGSAAGSGQAPGSAARPGQKPLNPTRVDTPVVRDEPANPPAARGPGEFSGTRGPAGTRQPGDQSRGQGPANLSGARQAPPATPRGARPGSVPGRATPVEPPAQQPAPQVVNTARIGFTAADVAANRRKKAAPEHEASLAAATGAYPVVAPAESDKTTVVPKEPAGSGEAGVAPNGPAGSDEIGVASRGLAGSDEAGVAPQGPAQSDKTGEAPEEQGTRPAEASARQAAPVPAADPAAKPAEPTKAETNAERGPTPGTAEEAARAHPEAAAQAHLEDLAQAQPEQVEKTDATPADADENAAAPATASKTTTETYDTEPSKVDQPESDMPEKAGSEPDVAAAGTETPAATEAEESTEAAATAAPEEPEPEATEHEAPTTAEADSTPGDPVANIGSTPGEPVTKTETWAPEAVAAEPQPAETQAGPRSVEVQATSAGPRSVEASKATSAGPRSGEARKTQAAEFGDEQLEVPAAPPRPTAALTPGRRPTPPSSDGDRTSVVDFTAVVPQSPAAEPDGATRVVSSLPPAQGFSPSSRPPWTPMPVRPPARRINGVTIFGTTLTRRQVVIGAAIVLTFVLLVGIILVQAFGDDDDKKASLPAASKPAVTGSKAPASTGAASPAASKPSAAASSAPPAATVPAGWKTVSLGGYSIAVPANVQFDNGDGGSKQADWNGRQLYIFRYGGDEDPASMFPLSPRPSGFQQQISLEQLTYQGRPAADWQYYRSTSNGGKQRVLVRGFKVGGMVYQIRWYTMEDDWTASQKDLAGVFAGFKVG